MRDEQRKRLRWLIWRERLRGLPAALGALAIISLTAVLFAVLHLDEFEARPPETATLISSRGVQGEEGTTVFWIIEFSNGGIRQVRARPDIPFAPGSALCVLEEIGRWFGKSRLQVLHSGACEGDVARGVPFPPIPPILEATSRSSR